MILQILSCTGAGPAHLAAGPWAALGFSRLDHGFLGVEGGGMRGPRHPTSPEEEDGARATETRGAAGEFGSGSRVLVCPRDLRAWVCEREGISRDGGLIFYNWRD